MEWALGPDKIWRLLWPRLGHVDLRAARGRHANPGQA